MVGRWAAGVMGCVGGGHGVVVGGVVFGMHFLGGG